MGASWLAQEFQKLGDVCFRDHPVTCTIGYMLHACVYLYVIGQFQLLVTDLFDSCFSDFFSVW